MSHKVEVDRINMASPSPQSSPMPPPQAPSPMGPPQQSQSPSNPQGSPMGPPQHHPHSPTQGYPGGPPPPPPPPGGPPISQPPPPSPQQQQPPLSQNYPPHSQQMPPNMGPQVSQKNKLKIKVKNNEDKLEFNICILIIAYYLTIHD